MELCRKDLWSYKTIEATDTIKYEKLKALNKAWPWSTECPVGVEFMYETPLLF